MAVIEYDEYKQKLQALEPTLGELEKALGIPKAREELAELQKETEQEGFWNDLERSQQVSRQVKRLENKIKKHDKLVSEWEDTLTLCEMAQEEDDPSQLEEVVSGYETLEKEISERHPHLPRRRRRHRGPGLDGDAVPDVHPLGRAPRVHLPADGL